MECSRINHLIIFDGLCGKLAGIKENEINGGK